MWMKLERSKNFWFTTNVGIQNKITKCSCNGKTTLYPAFVIEEGSFMSENTSFLINFSKKSVIVFTMLFNNTKKEQEMTYLGREQRFVIYGQPLFFFVQAYHGTRIPGIGNIKLITNP
jgi:hypothetical protein